MKKSLVLSGLVLILLLICACSPPAVNSEYLYKPLYGDKDRAFRKQTFQKADEIAANVSLPENAIVLKQRISKESESRVLSELKRLESDSTVNEIILFLRSIGGDRFSGLHIADAISNCAKPVEIRSCMAYSAAAIILASGTKGRRFVYKGSYVLIHQGSFTEKLDSESDSELEAHENRILEMANYNRLSAKRLAKLTGQSEKRILKYLVKGTWFTAEQAVKYGFADKVISIPKQK